MHFVQGIDVFSGDVAFVLDTALHRLCRSRNIHRAPSAIGINKSVGDIGRVGIIS